MPPNPPNKRVASPRAACTSRHACKYPQFSRKILNPPPPKWNPRYATAWAETFLRASIHAFASRVDHMPDYCRLGNLRENILSFSCNSDKIVEMKRYVNHITLLSIDKTWRFMLFAIDNFCKIDTFLLLLECTRTYSCMHISEPEKM